MSFEWIFIRKRSPGGMENIMESVCARKSKKLRVEKLFE